MRVICDGKEKNITERIKHCSTKISSFLNVPRENQISCTNLHITKDKCICIRKVSIHHSIRNLLIFHYLQIVINCIANTNQLTFLLLLRFHFFGSSFQDRGRSISRDASFRLPSLSFHIKYFVIAVFVYLAHCTLTISNKFDSLCVRVFASRVFIMVWWIWFSTCLNEIKC